MFTASARLPRLFLGTLVGAIATGAGAAPATSAILSAWTSPTAVLCGFLFVAACGFLAAVYLFREAAVREDAIMLGYFTRRVQAASVVAGALSLATLFVLDVPDPAFFARLTRRSLP